MCKFGARLQCEILVIDLGGEVLRINHGIVRGKPLAQPANNSPIVT
jgi:hypothetical protein